MLTAVTGCATKGVAYQTPSTSTAPPPVATAPQSPAPTGPMTPVPDASGQLTGTQLQSVLLPQSFFPAGFALASSSAVSSGDGLGSGQATYNLATVSCATFVNNLGAPGFGETAMASDSAVGNEQAYDQVVYQFASPAAASAFVTGISALAGRCHAFTASDNGATGAFSLKAAAAAPVAGHPSIQLLQAGTISGSSLTLDTLFTASGVDVFAASAVGVGVGVPTGLAPQTIVYNLMKRQQDAAALA